MPTPTGAEPRLVAARALQRVLDQGRALDEALGIGLVDLASGRDRALARRLAHGVLRDWPRLGDLLGTLVERRPARRDRLVWFLLAVGLTELRDAREPDHAVVHAAVEAARAGGLARLSGMVNAVLRGYRRRQSELEAALDNDDPVRRYGYPGWLIEALRRDWPEEWQAILEAGNQPPPLTLRVNRRYWDLDQAREALEGQGIGARALPDCPDALVLARRASISDLPGFAEGGLSVQDGAAQRTADYLRLNDGLRVLDACAAPGGKAAHILERAAVDLTALDIDADRIGGVADNLARLGLEANTRVGDATRPEAWWDGRAFDRILIDAPCSATGVIRRHPDIRWLRQADDIAALAATQRALLEALWPLLAPGGILVYATCSVLAAENHRQMAQFMERHDQARLCEPTGGPERPGRQILPGETDLDGFYHCVVERLPG